MNFVTHDDLRHLIERSGGACVSLYMPTHRAGQERQQDPIRLKNLLNQAEEWLREMGLTTLESQALIDPATVLQADSGFWQQQSDGLAIFLSQGWNRFYRLPLRFEELLVVSSDFHTKPLMPMLSGDGRFYILAVSKDRVRLLQGTRYSIQEVDLDAMPDGMAQALRFDDPERQLQFHTGTPPAASSSKRSAMHHGHGVGEDDHKTDILRYFCKVDDGVRNVLQDETEPLVLAGVDYLQPIYQQANSYQYLVKQGIDGNPDDLSADELHEKAWEIVKPIFQTERQEAIAHYEMLTGSESDKVSIDIEDIVQAAYIGQVETLFVATDVQRWGNFDPYGSELEQFEGFKPGALDLLDLAAEHTLVNRGTVYAAPMEEMPDEKEAAAVLRYSLTTLEGSASP